METFAKELNQRLNDNGLVQVTTYLKSVLYKKANSGMFFSRNGSLYVKRGKHSDKLSIGDSLLVGIRTGYIKKAV